MRFIKRYFKDKDSLSIVLFGISFLAILGSMCAFVLMLGYILLQGVPHISPKLFSLQYSSENLSMLPAILNTLTMIVISIFIATPIAVFGAVFLSEYANEKITNIINLSTQTLVGIPSIIYGLFGYLAFVIYCGFGFSLIAGILTLSIMILPLILSNTQETLKTIPHTYKEASFALGTDKLGTIFRILLPCAINGIVVGVILSVGRIIGESAALLYTSGSVAKIAGVLDSGRSLSVHMYALLSEGQYINEANATAVILLVLIIFINLATNFIAKKLNRG